MVSTSSNMTTASILPEIYTCMIANTESEVEGDDPGHRPGHRLHGQRAFVAIQQGQQRGNICQPAPDPSAEIFAIFIFTEKKKLLKPW